MVSATMIEEYRKSDIRSKRIIRVILVFCVCTLIILLLIKVFSVLKKSVILPIKQLILSIESLIVISAAFIFI